MKKKNCILLCSIIVNLLQKGRKPKLSSDVDLDSLAKDERCNCFTYVHYCNQFPINLACFNNDKFCQLQTLYKVAFGYYQSILVLNLSRMCQFISLCNSEFYVNRIKKFQSQWCKYFARTTRNFFYFTVVFLS